MKDGSVGECTEQVISERAWVMAKETTKGEELSALGKQTMAHAYSAMDYYFDHLKKTIASVEKCGQLVRIHTRNAGRKPELLISMNHK